MSGFSIVPGFALPVKWISIINSADPDWPFRNPRLRITRTLGAKLQGPQVYRFAFYKDECFSSAYVGEAGCFLKRHRHYKPKKLREDFDWKRYSAGKIATKISGCEGRVELELLEITEFQLSGVIVNQAFLSSPFIRRMLENFAICELESKHIRVFNRGRDQEINKLLTKLKKSRSSKSNAA